jgi:hypothetical protein
MNSENVGGGRGREGAALGVGEVVFPITTEGGQSRHTHVS